MSTGEPPRSSSEVSPFMSFANDFSSGAPLGFSSGAPAPVQTAPQFLSSTTPITTHTAPTSKLVPDTSADTSNDAPLPLFRPREDREYNDSIGDVSRSGSASMFLDATIRYREEEEAVERQRRNRMASAADGGLSVVVTKDGNTATEDVDAVALAHLYAQKQAALLKVQEKLDFMAVPDWVHVHPLIGCYISECLGTFAWVLILSLTSVRNQSIFDTADDTNMTLVPIGFMYTAMVFTFAYISGAHFNPAISIAVFLVRSIELPQCVGYILCQLGASLAAGLAAMLFLGNSKIFIPSVGGSYVSSGIFSEAIYTFAIVIVVLNVGYSRQSGNFFYGFAVGMAIAAGSAAAGRISGGAFNPAAATGLQLAVCLAGRCEALKSFWIYWLAPLVGSAVAALIFSQMQQPTNTYALGDADVLDDVAAPARTAVWGEKDVDVSRASPQYADAPVPEGSA